MIDPWNIKVIDYFSLLYKHNSIMRKISLIRSSINKSFKKQNGQSIMDNPERQSTSDTGQINVTENRMDNPERQATLDTSHWTN